MIKKIIPRSIKLSIHQFKNLVFDVLRGYYFRYAKKRNPNNALEKAYAIIQDLKSNESKEQNLKLAIKSIESIQLNPGEIFSFWKAVGNPTQKNGFVQSRSIVGGKVEESYGGGLCQLSGLIYYISIQCGLKVLERYNHTIDIYNEETRFTPLGSDATVAFGYKDLKIENSLKAPIKFGFEIASDKITVALYSSQKIEVKKVEFKENKISPGSIEIYTLINGEEYNLSSYKELDSINQVSLGDDL